MAFLDPPECNSDEEKLRFIEEITTNADAVQEQVLAEILSRNAQTEYLKRYGLDGAIDRRSFKAKIPVIVYEDIQSDIVRIANGNRAPILSTFPISGFLTSSGTSGGKRKLIPLIEENFNRGIFYYSLIPPIINQYIPGLDKSKGLSFITLKSGTKTAGGHIAQSALTKYHKSLIQDNLYTGISPVAAILCPDYVQSMYIQMLYALRRRLDVAHVENTFASGVLRCVDFLRQNWTELAHDIRTGTLTDRITDRSLRDHVSREQLKPDPELADFLVEHCGRANWCGIIARIWPNAKYVNTVITGSMSQYASKLQFYAGSPLPIICMAYASSECFFGINLNPMCDPSDVSFTLLPNMAFFEFLPQEGTAKALVDLANVEIGREYELVITTLAGLYRYRVGDILQATGFHNAAPTFKFVRRESVILSIDADKTNEVDLRKAVESASELVNQCGANVVEYTSYADTDTLPGHYVIYLELQFEDPENSENDIGVLMERCCLVMEEALNTVYRQCRVADGSIGPLEIRMVKEGTFEELMEYAVSQGSTVAQYKAPKCVKVGPLLKILNSRVASSHFSPTCPKWNPRQSI